MNSKEGAEANWRSSRQTRAYTYASLSRLFRSSSSLRAVLRAPSSASRVRFAPACCARAKPLSAASRSLRSLPKATRCAGRDSFSTDSAFRSAVSDLESARVVSVRSALCAREGETLAVPHCRAHGRMGAACEREARGLAQPDFRGGADRARSVRMAQLEPLWPSVPLIYRAQSASASLAILTLALSSRAPPCRAPVWRR